MWTVDTWGLVLGTWTQAELDSFPPMRGYSPVTNPVTTPRSETPIDLAAVVVEPPNLDRSQDLLLTATECQRGVTKTIVLNSGKRLEVNVPAGVKVGQRVRLRGHGAVDPVTGAVGDVYLVVQESEKSANYTTLRDLLKAQKWKEADRETYRLMITIVGRKEGDYFRKEDLLNFPCKDLKTIDRLWVQASQGRYGFSVQKEIYVRCGGKLDREYPGDEIWRKFGTEVGWRVNDSHWKRYSDLTWDSIYVPGHLPNTSHIKSFHDTGIVLFSSKDRRIPMYSRSSSDRLFSRTKTCKV